MTDDEIIAFNRWLTAPGSEGGGDCYVAVCMRDLGMWFGYKRLLFHWTLLSGIIGDKEGIADRFCYETEDGAREALKSWAVALFRGEPEGWHRHPNTGRRRPGGDKTKEYISD